MRSWTFYALQSQDFTPLGDFRYHSIYPTPRLVRMTGSREQIVEITLVEDQQGEYMGWIDKNRDEPSMIQLPHAFKVQFPGGYQENVKRGQGEVVYLSIQNAKNYVPREEN